MQSPLTLQRGRIESNPREYTHMGPQLCGELETMSADWAKAPRARCMSMDNWTLAKREWIFGRNLPQKPQKPSKYPLSISDRPKILTRPSLAYLSSLIRL